ncbi:MAG: DUF6807 family protein [Prosthecobacter sp.]|nr:DUF6807 family protein [Prosthecobacter sp.]
MRLLAKHCLYLCIAACTALSARAADTGKGLTFAADGNQLQIRLGEVMLAAYLMKSEIIQRPGFINIRTPKDTVVTRPFPVQEDAKNGGDHPDMHPGIWFGFGDINSTDFWRNKGRVEHVQFIQEPIVENGVARFAVLNRYLSPEGAEACQQTMQAVIRQHPQGWRLTLETELGSDAHDVSLGAQEEMGLGVRMAGTLNEKAGGVVTNSVGDRGAKNAWGKVADWWDYSGPGGTVGVLVVPSPANALKCWGHTRDYGVMGVNPTPRDPPKTRTAIPQGQRLKLKFEVLIHETADTFAAGAAAGELIK